MSLIDIPGFTVKMTGDTCNKDELMEMCRNAGKPDLLSFTGFVPDISKELSSLNILIYLLNPLHYGTTENALLEAMSIGIVPIVLNNPAESCIIEDKVTGYIVDSADELNKVVCMLADNPDLRRRIGKNASDAVHKKYTPEIMEKSFNDIYMKVISDEKRYIAFKDIFGSSPHEWFLVSQEHKDIFENCGTVKKSANRKMYELFEETKGSVFHFSRFFPDDEVLKKWSENLKNIV